MRIAIDAMGGDFAPLETVLGAIEAVKENSQIEVVLVGDEVQIKDILRIVGNLIIPVFPFIMLVK